MPEKEHINEITNKERKRKLKADERFQRLTDKD